MTDLGKEVAWSAQCPESSPRTPMPCCVSRQMPASKAVDFVTAPLSNRYPQDRSFVRCPPDQLLHRPGARARSDHAQRDSGSRYSGRRHRARVTGRRADEARVRCWTRIPLCEVRNSRRAVEEPVCGETQRALEFPGESRRPFADGTLPCAHECRWSGLAETSGPDPVARARTLAQSPPRWAKPAYAARGLAGSGETSRDS